MLVRLLPHSCCQVLKLGCFTIQRDCVLTHRHFHSSSLMETNLSTWMNSLFPLRAGLSFWNTFFPQSPISLLSPSHQSDHEITIFVSRLCITGFCMAVLTEEHRNSINGGKVFFYNFLYSPMALLFFSVMIYFQCPVNDFLTKLGTLINLDSGFPCCREEVWLEHWPHLSLRACSIYRKVIAIIT